METQLADRVFYVPFGLALHVVELPETQLRNWLIKQSVYLDANKGREGGIHRRFTRLDLVRLGLVTRLSYLGFAPRLISANFEQLLENIFGKQKTSEAEILNLLCGLALTIFYINRESRNVPGPQALVFERNCWLLHPRTGFGEKDCEGASHADSLRSYSFEYDTTITIDLGRLMQRQDERLKAAEEESE